MKYSEVISFFDGYNAIDDLEKVAVSNFSITLDQVTGKPDKFVLNIALNKYRANSESPEFPVFIPAEKCYNRPEHHALLEKLRDGDPFVYIIPHDLVVYHHLVGEHYRYFGFADGFEVPEYYTLGRSRR